MTDQNTTEIPDTTEDRRNPFLAVLGVIALAVAAWGLSGGPDITETSAIPWTILAVGLIVGIGLVMSGIRRR